MAQAWADGLNYFLATHPDVKPAVIVKFEPWMTLAFSEGSIGGDIEGIDLDDLRQFYDPTAPAPGKAAQALDLSEQGSNGIAIAPKNTKNGHTRNPKNNIHLQAPCVASPPGLEPGSQAPEASTLSVELWGHTPYRKQLYIP